MKRLSLFEFEDQSWFPDWMRIAMTKLIVVMNKVMGVDVAVAKLLKSILDRSNSDQIVDLGSGAGGPMLEVMETIHSDDKYSNLRCTLTDLYPNQEIIQSIISQNNPAISYHSESVDATKLDQAPRGIRTMINAFHHLHPDQAKLLLQSAADSKQPILIFEMADNKIPTIIWALFLPLGLVMVFIMALLFTPFSKPTLRQLIFTYLIPIIPICYAWDGQASMPRIYADSDIDELISGIISEGYEWQKGAGEGKNGKKVGIYLMGMPIY